MSYLAEKNISLRLPFSVLEKFSDIEGADATKAFYEKLIKRWNDSLAEGQKEIDESMGKYLYAAAIIPTIVSGMLVNNLNLTEAIECSKFNIMIIDLKNNALLDAFDYIEGSQLENILKDLIADANNDNGCFGINVKITHECANAFERYGIYEISKDISNDEEFRREIFIKFIKPIKDIMGEFLLKINEKFDIDDETLSEAFEGISKQAEDQYVTIPLGSVLSLVVTEAINSNITIREAFAKMDREALRKMAKENTKIYGDFTSKKEEVENLLNAMISLYE